MIETTTRQQTYLTPWDQDIPQAIAALIDAAQGPILVMAYGFNDPPICDALLRAHDRGISIKAIFDRTQSGGKTQAVQVERLAGAIGADNLRIGTSPVRHQIQHLKVLLVNVPPDDRTPEVPLYQTIAQASAAGAPITISGSYNFTTSAPSQCNNLDVTPGILRLRAFQSAFQRDWDYITQNEPQPAAEKETA